MQTNKTILIAGATGFVGKQLVKHLSTVGYCIIIITRDTAKVKKILHPSIHYIDWSEPGELISKHNITAVINLAGENIGKGRWTAAKKERILKSRTQSIIRLHHLLLRTGITPEIWIQASAIGYYGYLTPMPVDESSPRGQGFLAEVIENMEQTLMNNLPPFTKPIILRFGIVLSNDGGLLQQLRMLSRFKIGVCPGNGNQWISWIALNDLVNLIHLIIEEPISNTVINAVSPHPITMHELCSKTMKACHCLLMVYLPAPMIKIFFGRQKATELILADQRVHSRVLMPSNFKMQFEQCDGLI